MALDVALARRQRRWMDLTQAELARRIGVHEVTLSKWERGEQEPKVTDAAAWAKALDLKLTDLVPDADPEPAEAAS